jgi:hypothetical protein
LLAIKKKAHVFAGGHDCHATQLRQVNLKTLARRTAGMTGATHGSKSDRHPGDSPGKCKDFASDFQ